MKKVELENFVGFLRDFCANNISEIDERELSTSEYVSGYREGSRGTYQEILLLFDALDFGVFDYENEE